MQPPRVALHDSLVAPSSDGARLHVGIGPRTKDSQDGLASPGAPLITSDLDICYERWPENLERLAVALGAALEVLAALREEIEARRGGE